MRLYIIALFKIFTFDPGITIHSSTETYQFSGLTKNSFAFFDPISEF